METSITQDGAGRRLSSRLYVKGSLGQVALRPCDPGRICGAVRLFYDLLLSAGFVASFRSLWGWVVGTLTRYLGSLGRDLSFGLWMGLVPPD